MLAALLNNAFGGSSDTALSEARRVIAENVSGGATGFPVAALNRHLATSARAIEFDDASVNDLVQRVRYPHRQTFLTLSLLYEENRWGAMNYHIDHIFPRSFFTKKALTERGIPEADQDTFIGLADSIPNLELLNNSENQEKSNRDFEGWLST